MLGFTKRYRRDLNRAMSQIMANTQAHQLSETNKDSFASSKLKFSITAYSQDSNGSSESA
jgi:hypothetical protein